MARMEYDQNSRFAERTLAADHPERLRLAVKFSKFFSDVYKDKAAAHKIGHDAYTAAFSMEKEARSRGEGGMSRESNHLMDILWMRFVY